MTIENDIMHGEVFVADKTTQEKTKTTKSHPKAKTMAEATEGLKSLDAKKKKSKAGTFVKGTHGSGAAKMRAEYKNKKRKQSAKRNTPK
jgi:hypothetical protein